MDITYDLGDQITLEGIVAVLPTLGSMSQGSNLLYVKDSIGYADADAIVVMGAAPEHGDLVTAIVSRAGYVFTLALPAGSSVHGAVVGKLAAATVELKVRQPTLVTATPTASSVGLGLYRGLFTPTEVGEHFYRFGATGGVVSQGERRFFVRERRVT